MGFLRDAVFNATASPVEIGRLREDLRGCAEKLSPDDLKAFLALCDGWEDELAAVPADEQFHAVLPVSGRNQDEYDGPFGRGTLVLTSERLLYLGNGGGGITGSTGRIEIPLHQISMSGWGMARRWAIPILAVTVEPNKEPVFGFRLNGLKPDSREQFITTFETVVRDAERRRARGAEGATAPSAADELAKFAKLRDDGILSDDEFEAKKARLLG
jgi:Short C-terminal domain